MPIQHQTRSLFSPCMKQNDGPVSYHADLFWQVRSRVTKWWFKRESSQDSLKRWPLCSNVSGVQSVYRVHSISTIFSLSYHIFLFRNFLRNFLFLHGWHLQTVAFAQHIRRKFIYTVNDHRSSVMMDYAQADQSTCRLAITRLLFLFYTVLPKNDDLHVFRVIHVFMKNNGPYV